MLFPDFLFFKFFLKFKLHKWQGEGRKRKTRGKLEEKEED